MVLGNIKKFKKNIKNRGFTIVELLVVIVVIGILAAITIVSYVGITSRANTTKALANANSAKQVAEVFFAENGFYPSYDGNSPMTTEAWAVVPTLAKMPASITMIPGASMDTGDNGPDTLNTTNGLTSVSWSCYQTCANGSRLGGRIGYWNFSESRTDYLYIGDAPIEATYATPDATG